MSTLSRTVRAARPHAAAIVIAILAIVIAWTYAATALRRTEMGLPLDDSYIYLTYAKQMGRAQPLTYFEGSGYSAGATSIAWPTLLAPFWTLGARGHALVWAAFVLCALLYAWCAVAVYGIARGIGLGAAIEANASRDVPRRDASFAREAVGLVAGMIVVAIAAFAWTALSGMEVALTSALLLSVIALLIGRSRGNSAKPSRLLLACLVATSLTRPEASVIVAIVCAIQAGVHHRHRRAALLWLAPLIAPILWLIANRLLAGHWMPSTAIAKSQWFQPGFEWGAWADAFAINGKKLVKGLFWSPMSPLPQARLFAIAWLVGCVRIVWWAKQRDASARTAAGLIVGAPIVWCAMVLASSGLWTLHQYRYIAPMLPLLAIPVAVAFAPIVRWAWSARVTIGASLVVIAAVLWIGVLRHRVSAITYAQAVADTNAQVVKLGRYLNARLPDANVMLHDAGAIAYYGDGRIVDMLGLVTDDAMSVAANGPGARFEYLESLPAEKRPTHFAYYVGWLGAPDFLGRVVTDTPWGPQFARERVVGGKNMELVEASWDHVGTGDRPRAMSNEWRLVDRVDVADLASERAHAWEGALGVRGPSAPTTKWSFVARDVTVRGLLIDGGRTIRGRREAFTISRDPAKPTRLVLRTGGGAASEQDVITKPVTLRIAIDGAPVGALEVPVPSGKMTEVELELPVGPGTRIAIEASGPYRVFHWFVVQMR